MKRKPPHIHSSPTNSYLNTMVKINRLLRIKGQKIFSRPHAMKSTRENDIYTHPNYPAA